VAQQSFLHFLSAIIAVIAETFRLNLIAYLVKQVFFFINGRALDWHSEILEASSRTLDAVACRGFIFIHLFSFSEML